MKNIRILAIDLAIITLVIATIVTLVYGLSIEPVDNNTVYEDDITIELTDEARAAQQYFLNYADETLRK
jgi:hypothetical protein